jgi:ribosomally synthesized peptide (two-chain TOMM family)
MAGVSGVVGPDEQQLYTVAWSRIVARAWADAGFRQELLQADSARLREIYRELGYELPANIELKVRPLESAEPGNTREGMEGWRCLRNELRPGEVIQVEAVLPPAPKAEHLEIAVMDYLRTEMADLCCCPC